MSRHRKRSARFILFAICALAVGSSARASDMFWNTGSGSFHTAANWTGGIPIYNPPPQQQ